MRVDGMMDMSSVATRLMAPNFLGWTSKRGVDKMRPIITCSTTGSRYREGLFSCVSRYDYDTKFLLVWQMNQTFVIRLVCNANIRVNVFAKLVDSFGF